MVTPMAWVDTITTKQGCGLCQYRLCPLVHNLFPALLPPKIQLQSTAEPDKISGLVLCRAKWI